METTMDFKRVLALTIKHIKKILVTAILGMIITFVASYFFITPKYTSEALMYVESKQVNTDGISISELDTAQKLVNTCVIIFKSDVVINNVIETLQLGYTTGTLNRMISLSSVNDTEVLKISVTATSAMEARTIARQLIEIAPDEFLRVVKSGSIELISPASFSEKPTSPNVLVNTVIGFLVSLALAVMAVLLFETLDTTIKSEDDLYEKYHIPVFAEVMIFDIKESDKK